MIHAGNSERLPAWRAETLRHFRYCPLLTQSGLFDQQQSEDLATNRSNRLIGADPTSNRKPAGAGKRCHNLHRVRGRHAK